MCRYCWGSGVVVEAVWIFMNTNDNNHFEWLILSLSSFHFKCPKNILTATRLTTQSVREQLSDIAFHNLREKGMSDSVHVQKTFQRPKCIQKDRISHASNITTWCLLAGLWSGIAERPLDLETPLWKAPYWQSIVHPCFLLWCIYLQGIAPFCQGIISFSIWIIQIKTYENCSSRL
jgi:hypothetical protein